jgi:hypothetical protein
VKKSLLLSVLASILVTALAGGSCSASEKGGKGTPTPTNISTSTTPEEDTSNIIRGLVLANSGLEDVRVDIKRYYTDSSGTEWIGFVVYPIPEGATDQGVGIVKRVQGGDWELAALGTGPVGQYLPDDVKKGLGIDY